MKILVKFPTRGRPEKFKDVLQQYMRTLSGSVEVLFVITMDTDDPMTVREMPDLAKLYGTRIAIQLAPPEGKIAACNYGMDMYEDDYDIFILASDDMIPQVQDWDRIIANDMRKHFPNTDGVLWYSDGVQKDNISTMCIVGRKYFKRFHYFYHPSYQALWCDCEFTEVAQQSGKIIYNPTVLFSHEHWTTGKTANDIVYQMSEANWAGDHELFLGRRANNYKG